MRINAEIQRADYVLRFAIQAYRLRDRENVPFIESQIERRAAMTGSAKGHPLRWHFGIRHAGVIRRY